MAQLKCFRNLLFPRQYGDHRVDRKFTLLIQAKIQCNTLKRALVANAMHNNKVKIKNLTTNKLTDQQDDGEAM